MTAKGNSGLGSCVVVVGAPGSEFVRTTVRLAREWAIDAVPCDDVYSAVVGLAGQVGRRVLVLGGIRELTRENGAFFSIASAHAVQCCCLLDKSSSAKRRAMLAALRAGASVIGDVQEVGGVLREWLAMAGQGGSPRARNASQTKRLSHDTPGTVYEDLRATEAELNALLG